MYKREKKRQVMREKYVYLFNTHCPKKLSINNKTILEGHDSMKLNLWKIKFVLEMQKLFFIKT